MKKRGQSVAAVIVTCNRPELLMKCLKGVAAQTRLPDAVYIVDNSPADDTRDTLRRAGYVAEQAPAVTDIGSLYRTRFGSGEDAAEIIYVRKKENDGGAGGFYAGMHMAYEAGYDWLWMMDDDGCAAENELEELVDKSLKYGLDYANALVVWDKNPALLAFGLGRHETAADFKDKEIYEGKTSPFNGTFIRRSVIQKIGKVKKEMFIWGDETEYTARVSKNGFKTATICTAVHYHPRYEFLTLNAVPGFQRYKVIVVPKPRAKFFYRNLGYLCMTYGRWKEPLKYIMAYGLRFRFGELYEFVKWSFRGARNNFTE